jgi:hypothetical protein
MLRVLPQWHSRYRVALQQCRQLATRIRHLLLCSITR